jgi:uncharacterized protein
MTLQESSAPAPSAGSRGLSAHQSQRDLQWCLSAPSLLAAPDAPPALALAPTKPASLAECLKTLPRVNRLGHYYEQLWRYILTELMGWSLVAADRQICHAGRTLGALDLLHVNPAHTCYLHTELAVKFYLRDGDGGQLHHWLGPNAIDRLDLKLDRLHNHQLALPSHPGAQADINTWLAEAGLPSRLRSDWRNQAIIQGWLFHPLMAPGTEQLHPQINPQHLRGHWLHHKDAPALPGEFDDWLILPRLYWLAQVDIDKQDCVSGANAWENLRLRQPVHLSTEALRSCMAAQSAAAKPQPLLVAAVASEQQAWRELRRFMFVTDSWPQSAAG